VRRVDREHFGIHLGLIALLALALRVVYLLLLAPPAIRAADDTFYYAFVSEQIVQGHGFVVGHGSFLRPGFHLEPTAGHPPLYPLVLAGLRELGITSPEHLLWLGPVTGTVTVVGLGLLGNALGGPRIGLLAALFAAVYPLLIVPDGALLSETLYGPTIVAVLATALALGRHPRVGWAAALGAAIGVATLVRSEALGLVVLLAVPLAWRGPGGSARALRLVVAVACGLVVVAPWVVRNERTFGTLTLTTNEGATIGWANCALTYHGPDLGYFNTACASAALPGNEAQQSAALRRRGLNYAEHHLGRLPIVLAARLARTWGLFHPFQGSIEQGRNVTVSNIGVLFYYPLAALALAGAWALRRRRSELWVLLAPIVLASLTAAATFGSLRLRYVAELPLVLLAAVGAGALVRAHFARSLTGGQARRQRDVAPKRAGVL
jgi:Dolichyl-phosphate-mannose-protein mannosyltransferase